MSEHTLLILSVIINVLLVLVVAHHRQLLIGAKRREERANAKYVDLWRMVTRNYVRNYGNNTRPSA